MIDFTLGIYRHYKGNLYDALYLGMDEVSESPVVIYQARYDCPDLQQPYGIRPVFVRSLEKFTEEMEVDGKLVSRFELVEELA